MSNEPPFSLRGLALPAFGPTVLFCLGEGAVLPVVALSARELGASAALSALLVTLIGVGSWLFNIPASLITIRFGERWAITGAGTIGALALVAAGIAPHVPNGLWLLAVAMTIVGMATSVFNLARQKYLTEAVPVAFRARALSTLGGSTRVGVFIGPFAGAAAMQFLGLAGAYWVGAVAMAAAAGLSLTIPDLVARASGNPDGAARLPEPTLRSVASAHALVLFAVGSGVLLLAALRTSRQVVIPLWADHLGMDASQASLIYGVSGAIDLLVFYPAGKLMDRKGRLWVAVPSTLIMAISLFLIPLSAGFTGLLLAAMLIGFGNGISSGLVMTLGADFSPERGRGQFLGLWRFIADAGGTGGPLLLSAMTAAVSLAAGIWSCGVLGVAAAAVFAVALPKLKHRRNY
ncbi:transporter [Arthrobacter sp. SW1]|uniref:MFS transporter n=1 Tax=Arthrobacter sp. SW1 TaxID=1920889 RepID=UPI000877D210|nr:MFS transporter [Arthrobacter sp. SW1]OFI37305.1 transporter [Arthrobacter sp. SW1]